MYEVRGVTFVIDGVAPEYEGTKFFNLHQRKVRSRL